jgi:hypothetical protein
MKSNALTNSTFESQELNTTQLKSFAVGSLQTSDPHVCHLTLEGGDRSMIIPSPF